LTNSGEAMFTMFGYGPKRKISDKVNIQYNNQREPGIPEQTIQRLPLDMTSISCEPAGPANS
jgi:hypothetical protein